MRGCGGAGGRDCGGDGQDNDCDGETDENIDLATDGHNCGACGNDCADPIATPSRRTRGPTATPASASAPARPATGMSTMTSTRTAPSR